MQGNRVVVSRILTSTKFDAPRSMEERIREFVEANTAVSLYPFSADYAVKVAARKPPSADNKAKRKKGVGKNKRIGMGIFDPDATKKPGQTFYPYVRKFNRDGSAGDKPNIGWLDPIRTMKPSEMVNAAKAVARAKMNSPQVIVRTGKKNPRTGEIDTKALGRTIGSTMGNIGQAAARAIGIVVDANGRFRCPPGVPAANQFTDEVGSNCFDFTPAVGRLMVRAAQNIGAEIREQLTEIDTVVPTFRDSDGKLRLRSTRGLVGPDGLPFDRTPAPETILGPDGLPIKHVYPDISPEEYSSEVRRIIRETHPDWPESRIEEYAKVAEQRARMYDKTREHIQTALDYFDELGIEYDVNDPVSIQEASARALVILKEKGWDIDISDFYQLSSDFTGMDGELTSGNATAVVRRHNESIIQSVLAVVSARIISGVEPSIDGDDFEKWYNKKIKANPRYDGELSAKILEALRDGLSPSVFNDPVEREVYKLVASRYRQYQSTEVGFLLGFLQQHKVDPERTEQIKSLVLASPFDADGTVNMNNLTYNGETNVDERGLSMVWNPLAMIVTQPPSAASIGPFRLFETNSRGTEIARLKEIAESVSSTSRAELLDTYLKGLTDFSNDSQEMARGEGFNEEFLRKHFGRISQGMYINSHEMVHVDQLSAVAYAITHDREGRDLGKMTNAEALEFALEIMAGGNDLVSFSDFLTDSRVWKSAIDDLPEITRVLLDSNLGGRYPKHEYYKAVVLQDFVNAKTTDERYRVLARYWDELEALKKDGFGQTAWATAIEDVITKYLIDADGSYVDLSDETLISAFKRHNALTITELQAELGAALEAGLITETPEVRAIMAPLKLEKRLPDQKLRDADLATRPKKRRFALRSSRTELPVDDSVDRYGYETDEVFDAKLDNEVIGSTISLASRRDVSRWGASQRESVLESATPEQKKIVEGLWKKKRWFSGEINENGVTLSLALSTEESSFGAAISKELLPLADLVESSKLPNSVAVEINLPGGSLGQLGEDISDIDIETDSFITGIIKSNADFITTQEFSPLNSQRVIINVPEGSSGLPDYTPGTQKGEIGSLILPPGKIRVMGRRSDGTVMAKIDSQKSPLEQIEQFEPILERISSNSGNPLSLRVSAREAMIPIRGRRDLEKRRALRSQRGTTLPRTVETQRRAIDTPEIPSSLRSQQNAILASEERTVDILGRAKNIGVDIDKHERQNLAAFEEFERSDDKIIAMKNDVFLKPLTDIQRKIIKFSVENPNSMGDRYRRAYKRDAQEIYRELSTQGDNSFADRLAVTREIAVLTGDQKLVDQIDSFVSEVSSMSDDEFLAAVRSAEDNFDGAFDSSPIVAVREIAPILETGRYQTVHQGRSTMGGTNIFDDETVAQARRNVERELLNFNSSTDEETTNLRPASSFVFPRYFAEKRRQRLREKYGNDVEVMHPYQIGRSAANHMEFGPRQDAFSSKKYGENQIILRPNVAQRTLAMNGDTLSGLSGSAGTPREAGGRLSKVTSGGKVAANFHNPLSVLFHNRTQRDDTLVSPASTGKKTYVEGMVLGSFTPDDIQAIVLKPMFVRDSDLSGSPRGVMNVEGLADGAYNVSVTSLIASAKFRDAVMERYGIDAVVDSEQFDIDDVEPFNPGMTRQFVLDKIADGTFKDVTIDEFKLDDKSTPYEAFLKYQKISSSRGDRLPIFDHPKNDPSKPDTNRTNFEGMINEELDRVNLQKTSRQTERRSAQAGLRSQRSSVAGRPVSIFKSPQDDPFADYSPPPPESVKPIDMQSIPVRPNSMKLEEGPAFMEFGRDANGLPVVPPTATLKQKFGSTRRQQRRYFKRKYGITIKGEPPEDDRPLAVATHYGALQALDDLLSNIDHKELLKINDFVFSLSDTIGPHDDAMGTFGISTPWFFSVGKQKIRMHINHRQVVRKAEDFTFRMANSRDGKLTAESGAFVASFYLDASKVSQKFGKDIDALGEEVARRTAYAITVHEFGHLLDYAARHGGYKKRVPIRAAINPFKGNEDELMNRAYRSAGDAEFTGFDSSPSVYGSTSKQELVAEAFSAWWLFGRATGDGVVRVRPIMLVGSDGIEDNRPYGDPTKITDIGKTTITNLLEILGPRVKAAKPEETDMPPEEYGSDEIPAIAILYALSPFMMDKKE